MTRSGHHSRYDLICYNKNKLHRFRKKFELRLSLHSIIGNCYLYRTNLGFSIPQSCRILSIITNTFFFHFKIKKSNFKLMVVNFVKKNDQMKRKYLHVFMYSKKTILE